MNGLSAGNSLRVDLDLQLYLDRRQLQNLGQLLASFFNNALGERRKALGDPLQIGRRLKGGCHLVAV